MPGWERACTAEPRSPHPSALPAVSLPLRPPLPHPVSSSRPMPFTHLAVILTGAYWLLGRRLKRSGGRPTRRVLSLLVTATVVLGLLTVDAFTFALVRAVGGG